VDEPCLDRLVTTVDGVGADPSLAVVDDRALVVRPQEDERPVEREQRVVVEPVDAPVGLAPVSDHAQKVPFDSVHHWK
jgi:hypothetical protein